MPAEVRGDSPEGRVLTIQRETSVGPWLVHLLSGPELKTGERVTVYESPPSEGQERERYLRETEIRRQAAGAVRNIIDPEQMGKASLELEGKIKALQLRILELESGQERELREAAANWIEGATTTKMTPSYAEAGMDLVAALRTQPTTEPPEGL